MDQTRATIIDIGAFDARRIRRFDPPAEGAQILFFLGVRYERMPETPEPVAHAPAKRKGGRKRRA